MENLVGIVVGFALTTVAGGWWAAKMQERSWARQNDVRLRESENERAGMACQELMSLLDRRLYRMQRLPWAATTSGDEEILPAETWKRSCASGGDTARDATRVASELEGREAGSLNDRVYQFGLLLMSQLREGQVGRYALDKSIPRPT